MKFSTTDYILITPCFRQANTFNIKCYSEEFSRIKGLIRCPDDKEKLLAEFLGSVSKGVFCSVIVLTMLEQTNYYDEIALHRNIYISLIIRNRNIKYKM